MRIFYASDTRPTLVQSDLWRSNLYLSLTDLGHDVVEFQYDLRETFQYLDTKNPKHLEFIKKNRPRVTEELVKQIRAAHEEKPVDLFFSYFYDACILPEAVEEIKSLGIKTVNFFCNASYQLYLVQEISPHYDWCLVTEKFRLEDYRALGANPIYCQEAANPNVYKPYDLPAEFDVTFVGQAYGDRSHFIKYLLDQGIDIRVWGYGWQDFSPEYRQANRPSTLKRAVNIGCRLMTREGWKIAAERIKSKSAVQDSDGDGSPHCSVIPVDLPSHLLGGPLSDLEMIQMYSRSKINLGFSTCGSTHTTGERILQIRLRDFEVPMSGGFYLVEYMEELEEFFKVGEEIVCYHNLEDLAEKIHYYLKHDEKREKIRRAGVERCRRDHTWQKRFQAAFKEMGLK
ncbi:CgeB family protein [Candidatus Contubernalis alkaliaceticus]|uniref:CgeB family protein n=1 Tax=Candidatus Contubernalis alkaliaceticus TaxID=338645 RepID=UPI001F4BD1FB|nr:glycosyltransferase [Candidatus Contubernalis alkalaceticus]UNC93639.1 glycosyltransferase [Candidatus Contubernalis alkalaceticus]